MCEGQQREDRRGDVAGGGELCHLPKLFCHLPKLFGVDAWEPWTRLWVVSVSISTRPG